jgi:hypothetical protein
MKNRKKRKRRVPRYVSKLQYLARLGAIRLEPGSLSQIDIYHDGWCGILSGQPCHCNPEIRQAWTQHAGSQN